MSRLRSRPAADQGGRVFGDGYDGRVDVDGGCDGQDRGAGDPEALDAAGAEAGIDDRLARRARLPHARDLAGFHGHCQAGSEPSAISSARLLAPTLVKIDLT